MRKSSIKKPSRLSRLSKTRTTSKKELAQAKVDFRQAVQTHTAQLDNLKGELTQAGEKHRQIVEAKDIQIRKLAKTHAEAMKDLKVLSRDFLQLHDAENEFYIASRERKIES